MAAHALKDIDRKHPRVVGIVLMRVGYPGWCGKERTAGADDLLIQVENEADATVAGSLELPVVFK